MQMGGFSSGLLPLMGLLSETRQFALELFYFRDSGAIGVLLSVCIHAPILSQERKRGYLL